MLSYCWYTKPPGGFLSFEYSKSLIDFWSCQNFYIDRVHNCFEFSKHLKKRPFATSTCQFFNTCKSENMDWWIVLHQLEEKMTILVLTYHLEICNHSVATWVLGQNGPFTQIYIYIYIYIYIHITILWNLYSN